MKKAISIVKKILTVMAILINILFVIYFWNLDQKMMAKVYTLFNKIFDRKKVDLQF